MYSKERIPEPERCFPNTIVKEVCTLVSDLVEGHNIALIQDLDPALDAVQMDPKALHRVLLDLVTNAIDACLFDIIDEKQGIVVVSTTLLKNEMIQFRVRDNGIGMDGKTLDHLFTRVFSTKGQKGTGLGLLVTEKLIKENRGTIYVTSEPGKGSTFTVHLPFQLPDEKKN
jgi:signal transduction histidine kinase